MEPSKKRMCDKSKTDKDLVCGDCDCACGRSELGVDGCDEISNANNLGVCGNSSSSSNVIVCGEYNKLENDDKNEKRNCERIFHGSKNSNYMKKNNDDLNRANSIRKNKSETNQDISNSVCIKMDRVKNDLEIGEDINNTNSIRRNDDKIAQNLNIGETKLRMSEDINNFNNIRRKNDNIAHSINIGEIKLQMSGDCNSISPNNYAKNIEWMEYGSIAYSSYISEYNYSIKHKTKYFVDMALKMLDWTVPFTIPFNEDVSSPEWFKDGYINACYNCIDRHVKNFPDKIAIIEEDNCGNVLKFTFNECLIEIQKIANFLDYYLFKGKDSSNHKNIDNAVNYNDEIIVNDLVCVALYMPMSSKAVFTVLACARLGITHNVIFGGFTAESLALRISDSKAKLLITVDKSKRDKKTINFIKNVELCCDILKKEDKNYLKGVLVFDSEENCKFGMKWSDIDNIKAKNNKEGSLYNLDLYKYIPCKPVISTHPLFYLYTSGSTGKPKGIVHSTGGYLLYSMLTSKKVFNLKENQMMKSIKENSKAFVENQDSFVENKDIFEENKDSFEEDVFLCTADLGWITGHTYAVYGPLLNGCTTLIFGGVPTYPDAKRLFECVERHKVTQLYTAPTVIRMLQKILGNGTENVEDKRIENNESNNKVGINDKTIDNGEIEKYKIKGSNNNNLNKTMIDNKSEKTMIKEINHLEDNKNIENGNSESFSKKLFCSNVGFKNHGFNLSSLRMLGSVGEPINKEAFIWFRSQFGPNLPMIDTYWQTEAGGVMVAPMPGIGKVVPGCACLPFFGMEPMIIKDNENVYSNKDQKLYTECKEGELGTLVFKGSWPGIAQSVLNDAERYKQTYFGKYKSFYITGDEAYKKDGLIYIQGRADDVLNVAGHRLSTAEIESATCGSEFVVECAVVSMCDDITGQALVLFVVEKNNNIGKNCSSNTVNKLDDISRMSDGTYNEITLNNQYINENINIINDSIRKTLRTKIGPIVNPKRIYIIDELPKTRTGKIMRRVLRDIIEKKEIGDLSTCCNIEAIEKIRNTVENNLS